MIFDNVFSCNAAADADPECIRISIDTKAAVCVGEYSRGIKRLVVNTDNGPEWNSHRAQFMMRMIQLAENSGLDIHLVYYPPYHSKYNPVEHYWGGLERSWNGYWLDTIQTVIERTANFTWRNVKTVTTTLFNRYPKGNNPAKKEKEAIDKRLLRSETLPWWDVVITP